MQHKRAQQYKKNANKKRIQTNKQTAKKANTNKQNKCKQIQKKIQTQI